MKTTKPDMAKVVTLLLIFGVAAFYLWIFVDLFFALMEGIFKSL